MNGNQDTRSRPQASTGEIMDLELKGKKAIVTGASRGIGRAIAEALAAEGVALAICSRNAEELEAARKQLEGLGVRVVAQALDVREGDALKEWIGAAADELGGLDILVSNPSGGNGVDEASWRANFEVDLMGAVRGVDAALPHLVKSEAASVVFIGTTAAVETFMGPTSYNAIKAALITHANGLSQSLGPRGIRVNVVSPGPIYFEGGAWETIEKSMKPMFDSTVKACPNGRLGTPEEVANAVVFLASGAASLITGVNLVVDGGFTKRVNF
jgi:3-oxoacyl-[acyl-carrier protein] reductase